MRVVRRFVAVVVVSGLLAGCSSDAGEDAVPSISELAEEAASESTESDDESTATAAPATTAPATSAAVVESDEPVVRLPVNAGDEEPTNWVARTYMDDSRVEVVWSPVDGAEQYQLYRLLRDDADYAAIIDGVFTNAALVYEGPEYGYIDHEDVPSGVFLTYVLVAEVDGSVSPPRWTEALTITDTEAPAPIENLEAEVTDDGVLLSWDPSADNVEFAAYNVVYLADDGSWQYIGGGGDVGQTSFLDTEPRTGSNTYQVRAFDFHDNGTEPAEITVDVAAG